MLYSVCTHLISYRHAFDTFFVSCKFERRGDNKDSDRGDRSLAPAGSSGKEPPRRVVTPAFLANRPTWLLSPTTTRVQVLRRPNYRRKRFLQPRLLSVRNLKLKIILRTNRVRIPSRERDRKPPSNCSRSSRNTFASLR